MGRCLCGLVVLGVVGVLFIVTGLVLILTPYLRNFIHNKVEEVSTKLTVSHVNPLGSPLIILQLYPSCPFSLSSPFLIVSLIPPS